METKHPSLEFHCPATKERISLAFGYLANEPMMPIFRGDELVAMLPREVLIAALREGWGGTESGVEDSPSIVSPEIYQTPIELLELSTKTLNCLKRAGITKVGEVVGISDIDLLKIRTFGDKCLKELREQLGRFRQ